MAMCRIFPGTHQESHIESSNLTDHSYLQAFNSVTEMGIHHYPELRQMDFLPLKERRIITHLAGEVEIGTSDGSKQSFQAGDLRLMEDVHGLGHTHEGMSVGSAFVMMLQD